MKHRHLTRLLTLALCLTLLCAGAQAKAAPTPQSTASQDDASLFMDGQLLRMLIERKGDGGFFLNAPHLTDYFAEADRTHTANTVTPLQTLPAQGVEGLSLSVSGAGLVLERSTSGLIELELVGVADAKDIAVAAAVKDKTLVVEVVGSNSLRYLSAEPDRLVNVLRVKVPPQTYAAVQCDANLSVVRLADLGAPVTGLNSRGMLAVADKTVASPCALSTTNGTVKVRADEVTGQLALSAINGSVVVEGGRVTGPSNLATINGSVMVRAELLGGLTAETKNGTIELEAGRLVGDVSAKTANGQLRVRLLEQPRDLTLSIDNGKRNHLTLPAGWTSRQTFGSGKPTLSLASTSGGAMVLALGPAPNEQAEDKADVWG